MSMVDNATPVTEQAEALVGRLFEGALGTVDVLTLYIGDRLGLYKALRDEGATTPAELAARCSINERYAREWLEQQAVTGIMSRDHECGRRLGPRRLASLLVARGARARTNRS